MTKPPQDNTIITTSDPSTKDNGSSQLNSPMLNESGKPTQKAVATARQARAICKAIFERAKEGRIKTAGIISEKYNGAPPYNERELADTAQLWRNNFSTNFLASIIDRVKPQILDPIANADMLTRSTLPDDVQDAARKSRIFGLAITKVIRQWPGWGDFCSMLAQEDVCFGVATPAWIDKEEWRPKLFRFDEAFLPEGTGQHASKVQIAGFTQSILLHDFMQLFADKKAAELAGYDVEGCIKAANNSSGSQEKEQTAVNIQDASREGGAMFDTYANSQTRTVELFHLLVREYDGGVHLWTVTQREDIEIRHIELCDEMQDAITLFTLQTGNTKFYGSKGLGRLLTNLHIAIERGRCLAKDQEYLSGLSILKGDEKDFNGFQPTVKHPFLMVDKSFEVQKAGVEFNATDWAMVDDKLVQLAESIAGAFIPPNIDAQGGPNTKIEAAARAERDMAVRKGVLGRFIAQFYDLTGTIQRKICSKTNLKEAVRIFKDNQAKKQGGMKIITRKVWNLLEGVQDDLKKLFAQEIQVKIADQEAVDCIISMLDQGLNITEIAMLSLSPAAPMEEIDSDGGDAGTLNFITANATNPFLNQQEAFKMAGEIMIGKDRMEQLFVAQDDPNVLAIAQRQQIIELGEMQDGQPMPVAGTDSHVIHRKTIFDKFSPVMQAVATNPTPGIVAAADLTIAHYLQHLQMDQISTPDQKKKEAQEMAMWQRVSDKAKQVMQDRANATATAPGSLPAGVNGQPMQAGPNGAMVGDDRDRQKLNLEEGKAQADIALRTHDQILRQGDQQLKAKQIELDAQDQAHRHAMEDKKFGHSQNVDGFDAMHRTQTLLQQQEAQEAARAAAEAKAQQTEN